MNLHDSDKCCGNCHFFYYSGDSDENDCIYGKCLRFPPQHVGMPPDEPSGNEPCAWEQPRVYTHGVCGEWKSAEDEAA